MSKNRKYEEESKIALAIQGLEWASETMSFLAEQWKSMERLREETGKEYCENAFRIWMADIERLCDTIMQSQYCMKHIANSHCGCLPSKNKQSYHCEGSKN